MEEVEPINILPLDYDLAAEIDKLNKAMLAEMMLPKDVLEGLGSNASTSAQMSILEGEHVLMPTFEIASCPSINLSELKLYLSKREKLTAWSVGPSPGDGTRWQDLLGP
jgi:hypothetical protein